MNRKGQTLILFVFLIPIFLTLFALIIDIGFLTHEKIKLSSITDYILKEYTLKEDDESLELEIMDIYKKNQLPIEELNIQKRNQTLEIENTYQIESVFGKIIGIKNYKISIHKMGKKIDEKVIIEKE